MKQNILAKQRALGLLLLVLATIAFSGCFEKSDELRTSILNQAQNTVTSVKTTVDDVKNQAIKTKESVEKKVDEVNTAVKEVGEAVDALKKATN